MSAFEKFKHTVAAIWLALTGLTLAQINTFLGMVSLLVGISYQLWKWRKDARLAEREEARRDAE